MSHEHFRGVYEGGPDGGGIDIIDPEDKSTKSSRRSQAAVRLVLLVLADKANRKTNLAWPSLAHLSAWTRLDEKTVRRSLRTLERAGIIELHKEASKIKRHTRVYRLNVPRSDEADTATPDSEPGKTVDHPGSESVTAGSEPTSSALTISSVPGSESASPGSESQSPGSESQQPGSEGTPSPITPNTLSPEGTKRGEGEEGEDSSRPGPRVDPLGGAQALAPRGRPEAQPGERSASEKANDIDDFRNFLNILRELMERPLAFDSANDDNRELVIERLRAGWRPIGLAQKVHSYQEWKRAQSPNAVLRHRLNAISVQPDETELLDARREAEESAQLDKIRPALRAMIDNGFAREIRHQLGMLGARALDDLHKEKISYSLATKLFDEYRSALSAKLEEAQRQLAPIIEKVPEDEYNSRARFIEEHGLRAQHSAPLEPEDITAALDSLKTLEHYIPYHLQSLRFCAQHFAGWDCCCQKGSR